jgi:hypothetical protein
LGKSEGKGWARGKTATTDERIARRGKRGPYNARASSLVSRSPSGEIEWSSALSYLVGLIATDGCLTRGRTITFTSADRELVQTFLDLLGRQNKISTCRTRTGGIAYRTQVGDVGFYRWLKQIGITERKSLTLGPIAVPDDRLIDLTRNLLDGDGSIINQMVRADTKDSPTYRWELFSARFVSASRVHVEWLRERIGRSLGLVGYVGTNRTKDGRVCYVLRYGKPASLALLTELYRDRLAPCLVRKRAIFDAYRARHHEWTSEPAASSE